MNSLVEQVYRDVKTTIWRLGGHGMARGDAPMNVVLYGSLWCRFRLRTFERVAGVLRGDDATR